ncbi:SGNH/GDSL hydrolase family protein [Nocardia sp. NPDC127526]|uniref:SGNH/GDSL hydrolase family protein n=1 Tax=Nocardia sp. NPDC127526 TaxID=3345393 RepID=UPI003638C502
MPTAIQNLIVLGDSLSDIGIKREAPTGMLARATRKMRTNEVGRYSDGKNWTDFLVEWMGAESLIRHTKTETDDATAPHRSLTNDSLLLGTGTGGLGPVRYANFAEGGAIAASDWSPKAGALGYLKDQVSAYISARKKLGAAFTGNTLHIVWIGLNDIVTAERPDGINMSVRAAVAGGAYKVPASKKDKTGTGIPPLAEEINDEINRIADAFPATRAQEHFLLVDLPSPDVSVRYQDQIADDHWTVVADLNSKVSRFNDLLVYLTTYWPASGKTPGANAANVGLVRMCHWMQFVSKNPETFNLTPLAQDHGPVRYLDQADTLPPKLRRCVTTSDLAHPTEAVYELIARRITDEIIAKYTLGHLNQQRWAQLRPFPNVV